MKTNKMNLKLLTIFKLGMFKGAMFMYFLLDFPPFVETVGFLAVFMEAMLGVPQFYRNFR